MLATFGSFSRFLHFDKRGTGMSDPSVEVASMDERVDDLRAVLDAAGVDRAVLLGCSDGGPMSIMFAAMFPERTSGLILWDSAASFVPRGDDHPWGFLPEREWVDDTAKWGTSESVTLERFAPSLARDEAFRRWWPHYERQSASPVAHLRFGAMAPEIDVRSFLAAVHTPTLVLHREGDRIFPIETGRYLAARIPDARLVGLTGDDHFAVAGSQEEWMDEVREFVTGRRRQPGAVASWPRCCSPTWSIPPRRLPASVTDGGDRFSTTTTSSPGGSSPAMAAPWSRRPETASWRGSTARHAHSLRRPAA